MNKRIKRIIIIIISIFVLINVIQFARPIFRSDEDIKNYIINLIPIGTNLNEAIEVIENKKRWDVLLWFGTQGAWPSEDVEFLNNTIERKTIVLFLRDYGHPFYYDLMTVEVILKFDKDLNLDRVIIRQYMSI